MIWDFLQNGGGVKVTEELVHRRSLYMIILSTFTQV